MNLKELKTHLSAHPDRNLALALPDGRRVPAHYHVTEVGHIAKNFVDCGGKFRAGEIIVLQTYFGSPKDDGHRLTAGRLVKILALADPILPSDDLPVEVEYEDGVISQFPVTGAGRAGDSLVLQLGRKHTDCLARERCGLADDCDGEAAPAKETGGCCAAPAGSAACC